MIHEKYLTFWFDLFISKKYPSVILSLIVYGKILLFIFVFNFVRNNGLVLSIGFREITCLVLSLSRQVCPS